MTALNIESDVIALNVYSLVHLTTHHEKYKSSTSEA